MGADLGQVSILVRREIEARIAGPLIEAFVQEFGKERSLAVVSRVIRALARDSGVQLARKMGKDSIPAFAEGLKAWGAGGAYDQEELTLSETRYDFNITRCRYAEMYKELGLQDLGVLLSCSRDFELVKGFNPRMRLVRTQTIMEGHDCCDFRITLE